ncbi:enoyl-CoA hydratase [Oleiphilus sp. HI0081]|nr:enoyl-CoA hydratase [Oleiphilus sp. HI0043]KZY62651.1 enoyl-CoA hydratase [Oleiphilus sp. HI0061]KZY76259.1 enoyl-CoA hydratase [Oleiphilus sp. HI0068]KZY76748.1 enoyl-CoA hydratase [Oleiphilus sp. HI0069]KZY86855.1 enoyl-CoA hydratase [Oleiphilus sp. HI0072]KZZ10048.1 enoyl-CoA hydratase [Oleiphilus sp. HI0078]KZZ29467.1 enoyl-CoA hydratase [Oleiphilus sp. HI0081]KZZ34439.1 enoyl-CoA hydratase [Oleiphilus sp. HI0117]KZZ35529.1 enoyl-CoA hydratase [Oleiphilus sp. HI0086]KZZ54263.1 enoyl
MQTFKELRVQQDGHVLLVSLNRPDIHNAMSHEAMVEEIERVCDLANNNSEIRVMVLTGEGKSFCAGGNVKDMLNKTDMFGGNKEEIEQSYKNGIQRIPLSLWNIEIPVIAAVNGAAVGAGCDLAMMCDIRIASDKARFAESFVKLGIIPGDGGAWFLPRIIGIAKASQMALTGDMVDAQTALSWGMVSECIETSNMLERALSIAHSIASNPPLAVRATKKLLRQSERLKLPEMLDQCAKVQAGLHQTEDHLEAVKALLEKRAGQYHGH